jgi:phytoene synthase
MPMRSPDPTAADLAACREMLRGGSKSFHAASLLLPKRVRDPATALYAFCRLADDAVDLCPPDEREGALAALSERLDRAYAGAPHAHPADRAFAAVVHRHVIPRALPAALIEGFAWDAEGRRYPDLHAVESYAARVAAAVGAMMAILMGVRDTARMARACDLGVAMQLTNIARDVGEDARAGRLYLPLDWLAEAAIDPDAFLADPRFTPALGDVVLRLLARGADLYARAEPGIAALPQDCRAAIGAASRIYAEIGRRVARAGGDSVGARAIVPGGRKAWLAAAGLAAPPRWCERRPAPPLDATRFLVDAVAATSAPRQPAAGGALETRVSALVDLFTRLERRDLMGRSGAV